MFWRPRNNFCGVSWWWDLFGRKFGAYGAILRHFVPTLSCGGIVFGEWWCYF